MTPVMPPRHVYRRARRWETFEKLFQPIARDNGTVLWEPWEVPKDADPHEWWTLLDPMTSGQLYLAAGFHFVNRLNYVRCAVRWGGDRSDHPEYLY